MFVMWGLACRQLIGQLSQILSLDKIHEPWHRPTCAILHLATHWFFSWVQTFQRSAAYRTSLDASPRKGGRLHDCQRIALVWEAFGTVVRKWAFVSDQVENYLVE